MAWSGTGHWMLTGIKWALGLDLRGCSSANRISHLFTGKAGEKQIRRVILKIYHLMCVWLLIPCRFIYPAIQMATQSGKHVYVTITKESGENTILLFKFISTNAASGLYRAVTEIHAFYR